MEVVGSAVVEIGKCLWIPLKEHVGYLIHFHENVEELKVKVEDLVAKSEDVRTGYSRGEEVELWLKRATDTIKEATEIGQRAEENKRCLCCPNLSWRYSISKHAKEKADIIARLPTVAQLPTVALLPLPVENQPTPSIEGLKSAESAMKKVMDALGDKNIKIIGVWGMGGVGKTTLVKNVNNQMQGTDRFSRVVMVTVSKDMDIKRVQDDIASRLGLTLKNESSRAVDLWNRLMQEKRFLIILDDLWDGLDLAEVGIPSDNGLEGCKIILTTRREAVCRKMESNVNIKVDVLSNDESWKLFREKASDAVDDHILHTTAREVLKECNGLPLAIITVGRALRGIRKLEVWNNALAQLKKSTPSDIEDMEIKVYRSIKLSYDFLRPDLRPGFLFCCLFPEDYDIEVDRMIRQWMGEGFLEDAGSLEETLNRGHSWVEEIKASCLLLGGKKEGYVKMHDVVRDVGISIASKDTEYYKSLARAGLGLKGLPRGQRWDEYKRISLMRSGINEMPKEANCPQLLTLMMQENWKLREIPDWFLEKTRTLRVLDLSNTGISRLPLSLSKLMNLRGLCLKACSVKRGDDLSALGALKELEFLDLSYNRSLRELPAEIGELFNLRSLDLTGNLDLRIIPRGVISRLSNLEELKMLRSFTDWEVEVDESINRTPGNGSVSLRRQANDNVAFAEVASLTKLSSLFLEIFYFVRDPMDNAQLKCWLNLERFYLNLSGISYFGKPQLNSDVRFEASARKIRLDHCRSIPGWVSMLLRRSTALDIAFCKGIRAADGGEGFQSLEYLSITGCSELECVVGAEEAKATSLENLRYLSIGFCHRLQHIFPSFLARRMKNVKELEVTFCDGMEHVFCGPPTVPQQDDDVLPNLQHLRLLGLTNLKSIWGTELVVTLQSLTTFEICGCDGLNNSVLSSVDMKGGFPNLEELSVYDCRGLKQIISDVEDTEGLLPKLRLLKLDELPELVSICGGTAGDVPVLDWHSLERIRVSKCPNLKKLLPLQGGALGVPSLQLIDGEKEWWEGLEWDGDDTIKSHFQPLFVEIL